MKKTFFKLTCVTFLSATLISSCASPTNKVEDAKDNVVEASEDLIKAKADFDLEYNNFKIEYNQRIIDNEKEITELKAHATKLKKEAKADYEKKISELETRNESMKEKINVYKDDNKENWDSFKQEFSHDMDVLGNSLRDLTTNNVK